MYCCLEPRIERCHDLPPARKLILLDPTTEIPSFPWNHRRSGILKSTDHGLLPTWVEVDTAGQ